MPHPNNEGNRVKWKKHYHYGGNSQGPEHCRTRRIRLLSCFADRGSIESKSPTLPETCVWIACALFTSWNLRQKTVMAVHHIVTSLQLVDVGLPIYYLRCSPSIRGCTGMGK